MKPSKIFDMMDLALRARLQGEVFNPLFVGPPGLGKSHIVQAWAKKRNMQFIDLRIAYLESPDLIGFPSIQTVEGRQITSHAIPDFLPTQGEGVLILEEPNRGTTSVMNCLMQLLTDRVIHKYKLPEGWIVAGCINPEDNEYDVNRMDAALKDRFEIFKISYHKDSFVDYMKNTHWSHHIINFVESNIWHFTPPELIAPNGKYISPRTLSKLNAAIKAGFDSEDELTVYETILGSLVAKDFYAFMHDEAPVLLRDIENNPSVALKKLKKFADVNNYKNGMISITVKDIVENGEIEDDLLIKVLLAIPVEQGTALIFELENKRKDETLLGRICSANKTLKDYFKEVVHYGKRA